MSADAVTRRPAVARLRTGIDGLDAITGGGLLAGGVYIVQGAPGCGKTVLANHVCFNLVARGARAVYVTMLAESHARLMQHMRAMSFFDDAAIPDSLYYVSAFDALRSGGLPAVISLLRGEVRTHEAQLLVLDGLLVAAHAAESEQAMKMFVSELQAHSVLTGCSTLLLASLTAERPSSPEQTMVDGIVALADRALGPRRERAIEVVKFRGGATLRGPHAFRIGDDGITVYPRLESVYASARGGTVSREVTSTGIEGLDAMIHAGGLPRGSITALAGYAGAGKTTLALHFLGASSPEEPGLLFGFYESPEFLVEIARTFGVDLQRLHAQGAVRFAWQRFGEHMLDELAYRLLDAVREHRIRRVVIDGFGGFLVTPGYAERSTVFMSALANALRELGATTLWTIESDDPRDGMPLVPTPGLSALADAMLTLHVREVGDQVRRFVSIGKIRNSTYDHRVREVLLTAEGLHVDRRTGDAGPGERTAQAGP